MKVIEHASIILKSLCRDEGRKWESQPCAVLRHAPSSPAAPLVTTNNGKSSNENSGRRPWNERLPGNDKEKSRLLSHESTIVAHDVHNNERHITFLDQKLDASSSEKSTPPIGAPNAAARPAAVPAEMNSRRSLSLWKSCNWTWKPIILLLLGFKMWCKSVLDGYQKPVQIPSGYPTVLKVHNYGSEKIKEVDLIYNCGSQQIWKKFNNHP